MEEILHYVWKHKLFSPLKTINGESIDVIDVGISNPNAGPDFFNSKLKIGDQLWVGNIEIHTSAQDWYRHKHNTDKNYDSVILHLVKKSDREVCNSEGRVVQQCVLEYPSSIDDNMSFLLRSDVQLACVNYLSSVPTMVMNAWKSTLLVERLERKTNDIQSYLEQTANSWEDTLYILLFRSFGFGVNSDAFERLARSVSYNYLKKHRDDLLQIEAILFGQAGLLDQVSDDYQTLLKGEYEFLKHKYSLKSFDHSFLKMLRVRPSGFPQIRIAQLASIIHTYPNIFDRIINAKDVGTLRLLFQTEPSEYWKTHYSFGESSSPKSKFLGKSSLDGLIINVVVPMLFAYGKHLGDDSYCAKSLDLLEQIDSENNSIIKLFKQAGVKINTSFDSQAIIQLKREYCEKKKCLFCRIGYNILSNKIYK